MKLNGLHEALSLDNSFSFSLFLFLSFLFFSFLFFFFFDKVSLCSHGCPGTHLVDQSGLEPGTSQPLPPESAGIKDLHHTTLQDNSFSIDWLVGVKKKRW